MKSEELKIIVWNVNKLRRHSNNPDFKQFCLFHDIRELKQTDAAAVRRRPTSKSPFKRAQGQVNSFGP